MNRQHPKLGAHESIAGGVEKALARAQEVGCETLQIFVKSPNRWSSKPLAEKNIGAFKEAVEETGIWPVFAHSLYLVNLATPDDALWQKSVAALSDDLERSEQLGLPGLVLHPGSHRGAGEEAGIARIVAGLDEIHSRLPGYQVQIWLETTAGQGDHLGYRFEQLRVMIDGVREPERLGVCFDTAHVFAAGYELRSREGYEATWAGFEAALGLDRLRVIHVNDALGGLGSHLDRHAHIGDGEIGLEAFRFVMTDPRLACIPKIIETPKYKGRRSMDPVNLERLRRLAAQT